MKSHPSKYADDNIITSASRDEDILSIIFQNEFNLFQFSVEFHTKSSHLFCRANQITGFYIKRNTGLKWVNIIAKLIQSVPLF